MGFEFAAVFNNAMMPTLVPREKLVGYREMLGHLAMLLVFSFLIIVLTTMATNEKGLTLIGIEPLFGLQAELKEGERATGPLTAIWYLIFVLPLLVFTPDIKKRKKIAGAVSQGLRSLL